MDKRPLLDRLGDGVPDGIGATAILLQECHEEIKRLQAALRPFADVGRPFVKACQTGAIPSGASAKYLKLEPLIAEDFARAAEALPGANER